MTCKEIEKYDPDSGGKKAGSRNEFHVYFKTPDVALDVWAAKQPLGSAALGALFA